MSSIEMLGRYYCVHPSLAEPTGYCYERLSLDAERTALLVVDAYGPGFDDDPAGVDELPGIYRPDPDVTRIVRERIVPAVAASRASGLPVVHLANRLQPGMVEENVWRRHSLRATNVDVLVEWREPSRALAYSRSVAPADGDLLIPKQYYSGFFETALDSSLRSLGIDTLVVAGFDTRICLGNTVTDAVYRGYNVVVLRDAVRTFEYPETRAGGLANLVAERYIETNVGFTATTADWLAALSPRRS